jgi:hypothetical protein
LYDWRSPFSIAIGGRSFLEENLGGSFITETPARVIVSPLTRLWWFVVRCRWVPLRFTNGYSRVAAMRL